MRTLLFFLFLSFSFACSQPAADTPAGAGQDSVIKETVPELRKEVAGPDVESTVPVTSKHTEKVTEPVPVLIDPKTAGPKTGNKDQSAREEPRPAPAPIHREATAPPNPAPTQVESAPVQSATTQVKTSAEIPVTPNPPSHEAWDKLLRQYVNPDGKVDYKGLKNDRAKLEAYLKTLQNNPPQDGWPRNESMAFWINAYNAFTVKLILDNYPVSSITKLDGGKPWDRQWIKIGGKAYSLNNIENDILRPKYKDARIHFAVNCAAKSCPPLLNSAWTAGNLESNFEKQASAFINQPRFNTIRAGEVKVSRIFEWYAADFGNLIDYLNKYSNTKIKGNAKVAYMEYDWSLNE